MIKKAKPKSITVKSGNKQLSRGAFSDNRSGWISGSMNNKTTYTIGGHCSLCYSTPCHCYTGGTGTVGHYTQRTCGCTSLTCSCVPYNAHTIMGNWTVKNTKYSVLRLNRKKLPIAVFSSGRLLTVGILGSDVECAFTGKDLIFMPGSIDADTYSSNYTLAVEYDDEILHFSIGAGGIEYKDEKSTELVAHLLSTTMKGSKIEGAK